MSALDITLQVSAGGATAWACYQLGYRRGLNAGIKIWQPIAQAIVEAMDLIAAEIRSSCRAK